tara:strand:+ start:115 stop:240 length:126 start_codon:yes stop_codon:yes gene_type:complete
MDVLKVHQEVIQFLEILQHQLHQLVVEVVVLPTHLLEFNQV